MPHLRRALLLLVLLAPFAAGTGCRASWGDARAARHAGAEDAALRLPRAAVRDRSAERPGVERNGTPPAAPYLAGSANLFSPGVTEQAHSARPPVGPMRHRSAPDRRLPEIASRASRARHTRLERLDFASALDAACSGRCSVHSAALPPPRRTA